MDAPLAGSAAPMPTLDEIRALPKVELHAHLSGSIKQDFLLRLMKERGIETKDSGLPFDCMQDLGNAVDNCWKYFAKVAQVVTDLPALRKCALHVFEVFAAENCVYLELRTSPKEFKIPSTEPGSPASKTTKQDYLRTVIEAIRDFGEQQQHQQRQPMEIRLLVSIDRAAVQCLEDAHRQVKDVADLCLQFSEYCVGIDICGNPSKMTLEPYVFPALLKLHETNPTFFTRFPITCHTAETTEQEQENDLVINNLERLNIRRLGHVNYLTEIQRQLVFELSTTSSKLGWVGVELCPTSNMVLKQDGDMRHHHFPLWYRRANSVSEPCAAPADAAQKNGRKRNYAQFSAESAAASGVLVSVNTDDLGLFSTSLSEELCLVARAFGLSLECVRQLQRDALESSFLKEKAGLRDVLGS